MHFVSLLIGLSVAFGAALAMGGWQTEATMSSPRRITYIGVPQPLPTSTSSGLSAGAALSNAPAFMLILVSTEEQAAAVNAQYERLPDWEIHVMVVDQLTARAQELPLIIDGLSEAQGQGLIRTLKVVDLRP